jgi:hypothetical protein
LLRIVTTFLLPVALSAGAAPAEARRVVFQAHGQVMSKANDTPARLLAHGSRARISPDGRLVAFVNADRTEVRVVPYSGGRQRIAAKGARDPLVARLVRTAWSADSRRLVTTEVGYRLTLYDVRTGRSSVLRRFSPDTDPAGVAFSPSGARVAVVVWGVEEQSLLVTAARRDGPTVQIRQDDGADPVWGPLAGGLAFTMIAGTRYDPVPSRIGLSSADGRRQRDFGQSGVGLSPVRWVSHRRLMGAETVQGSQQQRAVALDTNTGEIVELGPPVAHIYDFSADGARMLAAIGAGLAEIRLADSTVTRLADDGSVASWAGT